MLKFSREESKVIGSIFLILIIVTGINIVASLRKGRDANRKNDLGAIERNLALYLEKYKTYPQASSDGKIIGCFDESPILDEISGAPTNAIPCKWKNISVDYLYTFDGKKYKVYIALEGKHEAEYSKITEDMGLHCGTRICNYGRGN